MLLQELPTEEVLAAYYLVTEWKPELINQLLSKLTPDNCRLVSKLQIFPSIVYFFLGLELYPKNMSRSQIRQKSGTAPSIN